MANGAKTKNKRLHSLLKAAGFQPDSPFKSQLSGGTRWTLALMAALLIGFPMIACLAACLGWIPTRFQHGSPLAIVGLTYVVSLLVTMIGGSYWCIKEYTAFVTATRNAPEEKDLLTYLAAYMHCEDQVQAQVAPIICELLGRLSEDDLANIPESYWGCLCPSPAKTQSGYINGKRADLYDSVLAAGFSAIMRAKRMALLPRIEMWRNHLKTSRHSEEFVRALQECHETLLKCKASLPHSSTLLRPSSEAATPEVLLRPVLGTHSSKTETGAQLLRASTGHDTAIPNQNELGLLARNRVGVEEDTTDSPQPNQIQNRLH